MAATLVSLFFIPVLMDNARAMMPDEYFLNRIEVKKGSCSIITDNLSAILSPKFKNKK
jgi:hypothetical protein